MREIGFLSFLLFFLEFSCPGRVWTEFGTKFFFFSFTAYIIPFWLKIMLERVFLNSLPFFSKFSCPGRLWTKFGTKIFFPFLSLYHPVLTINNARKWFFNFLNFFAIFFVIFFPGSSMNGVRDKIFFSLSRPISSRFG